MTSDDVVVRVVQLRGDEVMVVDATDVESGDDVGQCRPAETHSRNPFIGGEQSGKRQAASRRQSYAQITSLDRPR